MDITAVGMPRAPPETIEAIRVFPSAQETAVLVGSDDRMASLEPQKTGAAESLSNLSALVVTTDTALSASVASALGATDWRVDVVASFAEAFRYISGAPRQAVLVDQALTGAPLEEVVHYARRKCGPECVVITFLHKADRSLAVKLVRAGVSFFAAKPVDPIFITDRLADMVYGARRIEPLPAASDPLSRPYIVVATRAMELPRQISTALEDEYMVLHYDGVKLPVEFGVAASMFVIDDGMPNGLGTLDLLRAVFGGAPALAAVNRGTSTPDGFVGTLTKPVRDAAARKPIRQLFGRTYFGISGYPSGVVIRLRDTWESAAERETIKAEMVKIAEQSRATGRKWMCFETNQLQSQEHKEAFTDIRKALDRCGLHVGVATTTSDTVRLAFDLGMYKEMVHTSSASFMRLAQDLAPA